MAKNIWIYSRENFKSLNEERIYKICQKLSPDNINSTEPKVVIGKNNAFGILNPTRTLKIKENNLLMGMIYDNSEDTWHQPLTDFPDGSYALFREDNDYCELVSDPVASRTIWYYFDDQIFIGSTSQRAIIMYIGGFEFQENVIPWMLSTGTLGPEFSWDKRIKRIPADTSVLLNKKRWKLSIKSNPIVFKEFKAKDKYHKQILTKTLNSTFSSLDINFKDWILPLSGGYDSRGILCLFLKNSKIQINKLKTITWGLESSLVNKDNDAFIAKKLADELNVSNDYYTTDLSKEPLEKVINRFLLNGEGRIDHISGYMDGFKIWKTLFEDGVQGIIRGDEAFGGSNKTTPLAIRLFNDLGLCSDNINLKNYLEFDIPKQVLPKNLEQRKNESLIGWKDRLYHEHRLPTMLAALSDLKLNYVELINPLLSRGILQQVRQLPNHLRVNKKLFKKIVISLSPKVNIAKYAAISHPSNVLKTKGFVSLINQELSSNSAKIIFSKEFIDYILVNIETLDDNEKSDVKSFSFKSKVISILPIYIKDIIRGNLSSVVNIDFNILAFRIFMIIRMNKILEEESKLFL